MTRQASVAKYVRLRKERRPEDYCPITGCLWHTAYSPCRKHAHWPAYQAEMAKRAEPTTSEAAK